MLANVRIALLIVGVCTSLIFFENTAGATNVEPTSSPSVSPEAVPSTSPEVSPSTTPQVTSTPTPSEEPSELSGIRIEWEPDQLVYDFGGTFDPEGLEVVAEYEDGTEEALELEDLVFEGFKSKKTGVQTITVSYSGEKATFKILVLPPQVENFKSKDVTTSSFTLTWDKVEGASGYELRRFNKETGGWEVVEKLADNSFKVEDLPSGSIYKYMVRAYLELDEDEFDEFEYGPYTNETSFATRPGKVEGVRLVSVGTETADLQWDAVSGEVQYAIYRLDPSKQDFKKVGTTANTTYQDTELKVVTRYIYMVRAYTLEESNAGEDSIQLIVVTRPRTTEFTLRSGDHRAGLTWTKVKEATGYIVWMKAEGQEVYTQVAVVADVNVKAHVVMGLEELKNYSFYVQTYAVLEDGTTVESEAPLAKGLLILKFPGTSTKPVLYSTKAKVKKSAAYKGFKGFRDMLDLALSFVIPGIKDTNVKGFISNNMIPQATVVAGSYMLMTAYDRTDEDYSVIYVMDFKTKKYLMTLALPDKFHVGGMAYDGTNIWVTNGKKVSCFKYATLKKLVKAGQDGATIDAYTSICQLNYQASYITFHKNRLWVGEFNEKMGKKMYSYQIVDKGGVPTLKKKNRIALPSRTQGVAFLKDGTMVLSVANHWGPNATPYYISQMMVYKPSWNKAKATGAIKKNKCLKKITMPPMMEGIVTKGKHVYVVFESGAFKECKQPMDRICALKVKKLVKIKKRAKAK